MSQFNFTVLGKDGHNVTGTREATDRYALARQLRSEGLYPVAIEPAGLKKPNARWQKFLNLSSRVPLRELIVFTGSLSAMIGAGLALGRTLDIISRQTKHKRFKKIILLLSERINAGDSLSRAMGAFPDVFPPVFISMVEAGEESGNLPQSLELVRQQLAKSYDLRRKVRGAMIYPAIIVSVIIIIGILMMIFLVPNLTSIFKELNVELPLSTRIVIGFSNFLTNHTLAFVISLFILILAFFKFVSTATGKRMVNSVVIRLPVIKTIVKNLNAAITTRTISSLLTSGVSMVETLQITERVLQNPFYKNIIAEARVKMEKGDSLASIFKAHEKFYPILVGEFAEVGEETGNLSGMLLKGAVFFEEEVDQATKNLSTVIEPALMVMIGIFVGLFAVSMLGPMYSLSNAI